MSSKVITLPQAASLIRDGDMVALGGNVLHRGPFALARQLATAGKRNLHLVKTAVCYEADILCAAGCANKISAGFVGYETQYGLCAHYRKGVEGGKVTADEHACYTIITGLRAAAYGVPFLPVRGLNGSSLMEASGFLTVKDPYTGEVLVAVKKIQPDIAMIHVHQADPLGNARIWGPKYEDEILVRAAKRVIISCEELVPEGHFAMSGIPADISQVLVDYVVHIPNGGWPGSCLPYYDMDHQELQRLKKLSGCELAAELTGLKEGTI
jgi:glutaconate CoA-transferase subunit A